MTAIWGPMGWITLHSISIAYPESPSDTDKAILADYLDCFANCITCPHCQQHFTDMLRTYKQLHPDWNSSRRTLFLAICRMHNTVNRRLDKPIYSTVKECIDAMINATRNADSIQFRINYITHVKRNWSAFQNSQGMIALGSLRRMAKINAEYWNLRSIRFEEFTTDEANVVENIVAIGLPYTVGQGIPIIISGKPLPKVGLRFKGGKLSLGGR